MTMIYLIIYASISFVSFCAGLWLFNLVKKYDQELAETSSSAMILSAFILALAWPILVIIFLISFITSKK